MPFIAAVLLIALPWLNPFSMGPTPAVPTLLFSWACAAVFLMGCSSAAATFRTDSLVRVAAAAWLLAALVSALMGLFQYFGKTAIFDGWVNSTVMGEAFGNLRQRNQFATLTNIGLAALVFWCSGSYSGRKQSATFSRPAHPLWLSMLSVAGAVLLATGNAASSSRTGLMQLAMLIAMAWIWSVKTDRNRGMGQGLVRSVLVSAGLAYGLAAAILPVAAELDPNAIGILARLHESGAACAGRPVLWSNVLHLIAQKPWFGWGWGELSYAHFTAQYPAGRFCDILDNAHNLPLHVAVELGVPLAVAFCSLCLWLVLRAKPWQETSPTRQLAWAVLALIGLHSLLEYPLWYGPFQMAAALSCWLLYRPPAALAGPGASVSGDAAATVDRAPGHLALGAVNPVLVSSLAALGMAFCTYVAWDYWRISQIYSVPSARAEAYKNDTLEKIRGSWMFQRQVRFAELGTLSLTPENAGYAYTLAQEMLHFSPEPQVVQKLIESAVMLGRDEEARFYLERFRAAFPEAHARWASANVPTSLP